MMDRHNTRKQLSVTMPRELGDTIERIVEQNDDLTESQFAREAMRRELQRYEQEGYDD